MGKILPSQEKIYRHSAAPKRERYVQLGSLNRQPLALST
jgi:hypothetical protein